MPYRSSRISVLLVEDDPDDQLLTQRALAACGSMVLLHTVSDGEQLMDYLLHRGAYSHEPGPRPGMILLDLNLPRKDGRQALRELKSNAAFRHIPVVVLTNVRDEDEVRDSYDQGVNAYITKPGSYQDFEETIRRLIAFWCNTARLPTQ